MNWPNPLPLINYLQRQHTIAIAIYAGLTNGWFDNLRRHIERNQ